MRVRILREAKADLNKAFRFYERQSPGLGRRFLDSMTRDARRLADHAGMHEVIFGLHVMQASTFPFAFFYRVDNAVAEVIAILDLRRDPGWIERRLG